MPNRLFSIVGIAALILTAPFAVPARAGERSTTNRSGQNDGDGGWGVDETVAQRKTPSQPGSGEGSGSIIGQLLGKQGGGVASAPPAKGNPENDPGKKTPPPPEPPDDDDDWGILDDDPPTPKQPPRQSPPVKTPPVEIPPTRIPPTERPPQIPPTPPPKKTAPGFDGMWAGQYEGGGMTFRIQMYLQQINGQIGGQVALLDQGGQPLPIAQGVLSPDGALNIVFLMPVMQTGQMLPVGLVLRPNGASLEGFYQDSMGNNGRMILQRAQ